MPEGAIYSHAERRRYRIPLDDALRQRTVTLVGEIREQLRQQVLPPAVDDARCPPCSLVNACARPAGRARIETWRPARGPPASFPVAPGLRAGRGLKRGAVRGEPLPWDRPGGGRDSMNQVSIKPGAVQRVGCSSPRIEPIILTDPETGLAHQLLFQYSADQ